MDRPTALDLAFLDLDSVRAPLHVGWTLRLGGRPPSLAALRRHLDARLHAVPRFRRRLAGAAAGLGDLHWVDDPAFDVARHVHAVRVPAPGGAGELRETAGVLLSAPLALDGPLWRMHLVDGLADGWAIVGQAHHALVDGVAAVAVAQLLFDGLVEPQRAGTWTPAPAPDPVGVAAGATARRLRGAAGLAREVAAAVALGQAGEAARDALAAAGAATAPTAATSLDRTVTHERLLAHAEVDLADARAAGKRHGATLNDVLLAAASLALRDALRRRGEEPATLKVLVPVSVREPGDADLGNRISFLPITLPVAEADPLRVLRAVRARTAAAKARDAAGPVTTLLRAAEVLPGAARRPVARAALRAAAFNAVVSNVPGPPVELTLLGRPLRAIHPMVPVVHGTALSIGAVSYAGRLCLGVAADAAVVPDAVDLGRDLERAFDALRLARDPELPPWRARARERRLAAQAGTPGRG